METKTKTYLGDSVYAEFDDFGMEITTDNGLGPTNTIYLEPDVLTALYNFYEKSTRKNDEE